MQVLGRGGAMPPRLNMNKISKLYHTLKYLKPIQLTNRISRKFSSVNFSSPFTQRNDISKDWKACSVLPSCYQGKEQFKFLNVVDTVSDWNDETKAKLWLYNLHYFDDLNQIGWSDRTKIHINLINTWIDQNPPMLGNGWEPYTISLRSVNWIKWFLSGNEPNDEWLSSLSLQAQALDQQLEYHLLGNHLFANAKALVFAGCFFKGDLASAWLKRGLDILDKEIPEQILADGGNFELTPMYHNIILADMLDLYQLSLVYSLRIPLAQSRTWCEVIEKMLVWASLMEHPDGEVSFFNDSAMGIAPKLAMLKQYAKVLNIQLLTPSAAKVVSLKESGYVIVQDNINKLIIDIAKIGPDYIPGHAHADTLSFELSLFGQRVFVNSGTGEYGLSEERLRQRKTAAHNTVEVDDMDSSEVWSGFRVARRAYPSKPVINQSGHSISISCSHNGYKRLAGKVIHKRQWDFDQESITIADQLIGNYKKATAHYHLHPEIDVCQSDVGIVLTLRSGKQITLDANAKINVIDTTWHPEFGIVKANKKLVISFNQSHLVVTLRY